MIADDTITDGQTQAGATRFIGYKGLENPLHHVR